MHDKDIFHIKTEKKQNDDFFDILESEKKLKNTAAQEALKDLKKTIDKDSIINWTKEEQQTLLKNIQNKKIDTKSKYFNEFKQELEREKIEKDAYSNAYWELKSIQKDAQSKDNVEKNIDAFLQAKEIIINRTDFQNTFKQLPQNVQRLIDLEAENFYALIAKESHFDARQESSTNAKGLMQIRQDAFNDVKDHFPQIAKNYGDYKNNSIHNCIIGILYQFLMQKKVATIYENEYQLASVPASQKKQEVQTLALAAYNMGEGNLARGICSAMPSDIKNIKDKKTQKELNESFGWQKISKYLSYRLDNNIDFRTQIDKDNFTEITYKSWLDENNNLGELEFSYQKKNTKGKLETIKRTVKREKIIQTVRYVEIVDSIKKHIEKRATILKSAKNTENKQESIQAQNIETDKNSETILELSYNPKNTTLWNLLSEELPNLGLDANQVRLLRASIIKKYKKTIDFRTLKANQIVSINITKEDLETVGFKEKPIITTLIVDPAKTTLWSLLNQELPKLGLSNEETKIARTAIINRLKESGIDFSTLKENLEVSIYEDDIKMAKPDYQTSSMHEATIKKLEEISRETPTLKTGDQILTDRESSILFRTDYLIWSLSNDIFNNLKDELQTIMGSGVNNREEARYLIMQTLVQYNQEKNTQNRFIWEGVSVEPNNSGFYTINPALPPNTVCLIPSKGEFLETISTIFEKSGSKDTVQIPVKRVQTNGSSVEISDVIYTEIKGENVLEILKELNINPYFDDKDKKESKKGEEICKLSELSKQEKKYFKELKTKHIEWIEEKIKILKRDKSGNAQKRLKILEKRLKNIENKKLTFAELYNEFFLCMMHGSNIDNFTIENPDSLENTQGKKIDHIILHSTGGNDIDIGRRCHFVVGKDGEIRKITSETRKLDHVGDSSWQGYKRADFRDRSIGIEVVSGCNEEWTDEQYQSVKLLTTYLSSKYEVKKRNILGHYQVSSSSKYKSRFRKSDPFVRLDWEKLGMPDNSKLVDWEILTGELNLQSKEQYQSTDRRLGRIENYDSTKYAGAFKSLDLKTPDLTKNLQEKILAYNKVIYVKFMKAVEAKKYGKHIIKQGENKLSIAKKYKNYLKDMVVMNVNGNKITIRDNSSIFPGDIVFYKLVKI